MATPQFQIRLRQSELDRYEQLRVRFGVKTVSDAIRLCASIVCLMDEEFVNQFVEKSRVLSGVQFEEREVSEVSETVE